jgi:DNA-binding NarL/FixJ family response regulator
VSIRVLLVDDEQLVRTGFRMILESTDDIVVVGEASTGVEALTAAGRLSPDVVLMDVRMPVMDGIEATQRLMESEHPPRVLVLTTFDLDDYVHRALQVGASGFLLKDLSAAGLAEAVRVVFAGEALLAPSATRRLVERYRGQPLPDSHALDMLTGRELEVLQAVVRGRTNTEIAAELYLAGPTVKTYVGRLLAKLEARDRVHLVILGYTMGLDLPGS